MDPKLLETIRMSRVNQTKVHSIMKEMLGYLFFIYVLMTVSGNQRDPSAWLLRENLRHSMVHEGRADGTDFMAVRIQVLFLLTYWCFRDVPTFQIVGTSLPTRAAGTFPVSL